METMEITQILTVLAGILFSAVAYLLKRSIDTLDKTIKEHGSKINDHDIQIALNAHTTDEVYKLIDVRLQSIDNNFRNVSDEMKRMSAKIDKYDDKINDFYKMYKLEEK